MAIARVVPLRRLPTDRPWFDYRLPAGEAIEPGHLVTIPFMRGQVRGIVWDLAEDSAVPRLRTIIKKLQPDPVITAWQRRIVEELQAQTFASFGHLLDHLIPTYSSRSKSQSDFATMVTTQPLPPVWPSGQTWWYRNRQQAEEWLISWISQ